MLKPRIKKIWLQALRSGKYKQTKDVLHDSKGFCCLGVLSDLYLKEKGLRWSKHKGMFNRTSSTKSHKTFDTHSTLPKVVMDWSGVYSHNPALIDTESPLGGHENASRMNDGMNYDFKKIADCIEKTTL